MRIRVFAMFLLAMSLSFAPESFGARESRTIGDVRRVVEKHKGAFYALYARALRDNPALRGEVLLSISIAPDGTVTKCAVASSTLNDPALEKRFVERFLTIPFGAKGQAVFSDPAYPMSFFSSREKSSGSRP